MSQFIPSVLLCHHPTNSVLSNLAQAVAFRRSSLRRWIRFSPDPECADIFYDFNYRSKSSWRNVFSIYCFFSVLVFI